MNLHSHSHQALEIASQSRFPIAYAGDGWLYWGSLFALLVMTLLLTETFVHISFQIYKDRKQPSNAVLSLRITFLLVALTAMIRIIPDAVYRVAWGETYVKTLQLILAIKESCNLVAVGSLVAWIMMHRYYEPVWTLRLNTSMNQIWGGNRRFLKHALIMTILSGLLAGSITFYKAFV